MHLESGNLGLPSVKKHLLKMAPKMLWFYGVCCFLVRHFLNTFYRSQAWSVYFKTTAICESQYHHCQMKTKQSTQH